jgi:putative hydrolase of the HAD superfamily
MAGPLLDMLLFDIDDTLYSTTVFSERARRAAVRAMIERGLLVDEEEGVLELTEVVGEFSSNYGNHFERLLDRLGPERYPRRNPAVLVAAGVVAYHNTKRDGLEMLPDVQSVLLRLYSARIRLGVLSVGLHVKQAEKLIRLDAIQFFDPTAIFFSDQMGISKPNPKIFAKACQAAGVQPSRVLYIGDRPTHDAGPAAKAGLKTVLYTGASGKYGGQPCDVQPDHTMGDLRELIPILRATYHLDV